MSECGPTTRSLDGRLDDLAADVHEVLSDVAGLRLDTTSEFGRLREGLGDYRLETEQRFGSIEKVLSGIQEQLKFIRWVGVFFAGILVAAVAGAGRVVWDAATINAEVKHQGERLEMVAKRLDGIDTKLDTLIRRGEPRARVE